jgi:imidazole glycerol-phosphate synthase subunit HisF
MLNTRVIPTLLLRNQGLVKGSRFAGHRYVGDPINAVKILNEKEVDELIFLDIGASQDGTDPNMDLLQAIVGEAFMPVGYGGGITSCAQVERLLALGVEKTVLNTAVFTRPELVREASTVAGAQSIVVSIDVRRHLRRYEVWVKAGTLRTRTDPVTWARRAEDLGAGEIVLCSIDREGTRSGYDLELVRAVADAVQIPVVAAGGAGGLADFAAAVREGHASAVAAGDLFVFHGKHKAVLITYPPRTELEALFGHS